MMDLDAVPVPDFDFSAIQQRARGIRTARKRSHVLSIAALSVLVPALAAAAAVQIWPVHVVQNGKLFELSAHRATAQFRSTPAQLHHLAATASFPITLPAGLPAGSTLHTAVLIGSEVLMLNYGSGHGFARFIISPEHWASPIKGGGSVGARIRLTPLPRNYRWDVRGEHVLLGTDYLTNAQVAHIRAAMSAAGKEQGQR